MTQQQFEDTVRNYGESEFYDLNLKRLSSQTAEGRLGGRRNLSARVNEVEPAANLNPHTPDNIITDFGVRFRERHKRIAGSSITDSAVDYAQANRTAKFTDNFAEGTPIEIAGNNDHNVVVGNHLVYKSLGDALESYIDAQRQGRAVTSEQLLRGTAQIVQRDASNRLGGENNDPEHIADLVSYCYQSSPAHVIFGTASRIRDEALDRMKAQVPEDQRAAYAGRTLKAHIATGDDGKLTAARDLYKITL